MKLTTSLLLLVCVAFINGRAQSCAGFGYEILLTKIEFVYQKSVSNKGTRRYIYSLTIFNSCSTGWSICRMKPPNRRTLIVHLCKKSGRVQSLSWYSQIIIRYYNRSTIEHAKASSPLKSIAQVPSCKDNESAESGPYWPKMPSPTRYQIYCQQNLYGGGWIVFQKRTNGVVDFYRNWAAYKKGFGDMSSEFWIGLEKIHSVSIEQSGNISSTELLVNS